MDTTTWVGWVWRGDRWERVCDGDTLRQCHLYLIDLMPPGAPNTHGAMTSGFAPTWRPDAPADDRPAVRIV